MQRGPIGAWSYAAVSTIGANREARIRFSSAAPDTSASAVCGTALANAALHYSEDSDSVTSALSLSLLYSIIKSVQHGAATATTTNTAVVPPLLSIVVVCLMEHFCSFYLSLSKNICLMVIQYY